VGERLGMVARRVADDIHARLLQQQVEGAAHLEGTGVLEVLVLDDDLGARRAPLGHHAVELRVRRRRRADHEAAEPASGGEHVGDGRWLDRHAPSLRPVLGSVQCLVPTSSIVDVDRS
jgi:hypothetical protein